MAGLIDEEANVQSMDELAPNKVAGSVATTYDAAQSQVNTDTDTVRGQMNSLMAENSDYRKMAETQAKQEANQRGLLNSSMAVRSGYQAALGSAMPIAASDAQTYNQQRLINQQYENQARQFGAATKTQNSQFNAQNLNAVQSQRIAGDIQGELMQLDADLKTGQIMPAEYENQKQILQLQHENQLAGMDKQAEINKEMAQLDADLKTGQIMPAAHDYEIKALQKQLDNAIALQDAQLEMQKALQQMKGDQALQIAQLEGAYKNLIQSSASASNLYQDITRSLTALYADPDLTEQQKTDSAARIGELLESGLTIIGAVADLDLAGLLDFGQGV